MRTQRPDLQFCNHGSFVTCTPVSILGAAWAADNILQPGELPRTGSPIVFASDFIDFSIYIDADEDVLLSWYVERFMKLRETAFRDPKSYFRRFAELSAADAVQTATRIWNTINLPNLKENILPTRGRADLILKKGTDHAIHEVALRKV